MSLMRGPTTYDDLAWAEMSACPSCPPVTRVFVIGPRGRSLEDTGALVEMSAH